MDSASIKLFKDENTQFSMPNVGNIGDQQEQLKSEDILPDISGETVKIIRMKEDTVIDPVNFFLDITNVQLNSSQKDVLKSLVSKHGDVSIYLYKNGNTNKIGLGNKEELERLLHLIKKHVFMDTLKIYKNVVPGEKPKEIGSKDITKYRLNI